MLNSFFLDRLSIDFAFTESDIRIATQAVSAMSCSLLASHRITGTAFQITLLLPTAAQGFVQLNQSEKLVSLSLRQAQLCGEGIGLVGEHLQIVSGACVEALMR